MKRFRVFDGSIHEQDNLECVGEVCRDLVGLAFELLEVERIGVRP